MEISLLVHFFKDVVDCVAKQRARLLFFFSILFELFPLQWYVQQLWTITEGWYSESMIYWAIPENIHTTPWIAFWNSKGKGGSLNWKSEGMAGGITHFGNCEGKGRLWKYERGRTELSQVNNGVSLWILPKVYCLKFWMTSFHSIKFNGCKMMCMK